MSCSAGWCARFGGVPGIRAIVLGGSRARGEATAQSDYDIGLYYEADNPIDVGRLAKAAMLLPGAASSSVTAIGEWGPWINGGAWLTVDGHAGRPALPRARQGARRDRGLPCRPDRAGLPARPSARLRVGDLHGRGGARPRAVGPRPGAGAAEAAVHALSAGARRGADPDLPVGGEVRGRECPARPRPRRPGLCRGLRLPRRRLPLPEPVRPERRLSPEREGRGAGGGEAAAPSGRLRRAGRAGDRGRRDRIAGADGAGRGDRCVVHAIPVAAHAAAC